jgi:hypothetical protein
MGDRPTAPKLQRTPVSQPKAASGLPEPVVHETTARVAAPSKPPLPNVFWGALGCVSVLGIGFTVLFVFARPGSPAAPPPAAPLAATAVAVPAQRPGLFPDIQPLAPPPAPAEPAAAHLKPAARPIKMARAAGAEGGPSTSASRKTERKSQKAGTGDQAADGTDDSAPSKKAAGDTAASADKPADQGTSDDDQPAPRHRERASDDPDDD